MDANGKPSGIIAIAIMACYNGLLLVVAGLLWALAEGLSQPRFLCVVGGMLLLVLGMVFFTGVYGLFSGEPWGRNRLIWSFTAFLPMQVIAIFPIFQNDAMTVGNTLLQIAGITATLLILRCLSHPRRRSPGRERLDFPPASAMAEDTMQEERAFTFDRRGSDRPST